MSLSQPSSEPLRLSPCSIPPPSSRRGLPPCLFSPYSGYSDYGVTSPLQGSQEITSTLSSQPASPSPILLHSPSSSTPVNTPSSSRVASPVTAQGQTQGVISPVCCGSIYLRFRFIFSLAYFYASCQYDPLPPCLITPFQAISLPEAKLQQVIQASERTQVPYDAWLLQFRATKRPGALQVLLAEKGVFMNGNDR